MEAVAHHRPGLGVLFMSLGMFCISINDMVVKSLAGDYPLYQLVTIRATIAALMTLALVRYERAGSVFAVPFPGLQALRAGFLVLANCLFYLSLVVMPLATTTALYFVAPLFVTLLAIPVLNEVVGVRRIAAVAVGFGGVLVILWPELQGAGGFGLYAVLPIMAAAGYAGLSVMTRKLGAYTPGSLMAFWAQMGFVITGVAMFGLVGDGRFAGDPDGSAGVYFLLRPWVWPAAEDWPVLALLGALSGVVGYVMAQAYRLAAASTVAPFEYLLILYALFWGWTVFGEWPAPTVFLGAGIIVASGIFILWRAR